MEIVAIEKKTFEAMVAKFDRFVRRMDAICHRHGEKTMGKWMDNQDVCQMLNISPRTLQTLLEKPVAIDPLQQRVIDPRE